MKADISAQEARLNPQQMKSMLTPSSKLAQLHAAGEIGPAEIAAALRWTEDYHSHEYGYHERRGAGGCIHAGMIARAKAGKRLEEVEEALGPDAQQRLIALLGEAHSYKVGAKIILGDEKARDAIRAQFVLLLHQLAHRYRCIDSVQGQRQMPSVRQQVPISVAMPAWSR